MLPKGLLLALVAVSLVGTTTAFDSPFQQVRYDIDGPSLVMNMSSKREISVLLDFDKDAIPAEADLIIVSFQTRTLSPQFNILSLDSMSTRITIPRRPLASSGYQARVSVRLYANYIGRANLQPSAVEFITSATRRSSAKLVPRNMHLLSVTIVQYEGVWGTIFIVSVTLLMLISYVNLGAQLDLENMKQIVRKPKVLILGFLIGQLVMPVIAWFVGLWLLKQQVFYRVGSFIFACCPAASASTLWSVMLNADKELSVGLQVLSTLGAVLTMPSLLYFMDYSLRRERATNFIITIPYWRFIQTLLALTVALFIGWRFIGQNAKAQKMSTKLFRPLTFSVLLFIIVFSSILYWHIYQMFDSTVILASLIITLSTFLIAGTLGHLVSCNFAQGVTIAIGSAYKNSGIAFAVLLLAFGPPDTYIAYVPCLAQICITSLSLYLIYSLLWLVNCVRRRGQPATIQASQPEDQTRELRDDGSDGEGARRTKKSGSFGDKSIKSEENDEFIAMNVTDLEPGSLPKENKLDDREENANDAQQVAIKMIDDGGGDDEGPDDKRKSKVLAY